MRRTAFHSAIAYGLVLSMAGVASAATSVDLNFATVNASGSTAAAVNLNNVAGAVDASAGALSNATGAVPAVDINATSANVTLGTSVINALGVSVEVTNSGSTAGGGNTIALTGAIADSGAGIRLDNNDQNTNGATVRFGGTLTLNTGASTAFNAVNGGRVEATGSGSVITTTTGTGVNIANTTIGASGVTFQTVSVNGAPNGIVLNSTGNTGVFSVTADGSMTGGVLNRNGSGGALVTTGHSVLLNQANGVMLRQMNIPSSGADAIHSTAGGDYEFSALSITTPTGDGWEAIDLAGTNRVDHDTLISGINNAGTSGVIVSNTSTNLAGLTLDGSTFTNSTGGQGMVVVRGLGTSSMTLTISDANTADGADSVFSNLNQSAVIISAGTDAGSTSTITTNVSDTEFRDGPVGGFNNIEIQALENGTANFNITGNLFSNLDPPGANSGIVLLQATVNGTLGATTGANGTVANNTFTGIDGRRGIHLTSNNAASNHNIIVSGNMFDDLEREAMFVSARDTTSGFDLRVAGNTFGTAAAPVGNTDREAVEILSENTAQLTAEFTGNTLVNASGSGFSQALRLASFDDAVLNIAVTNANTFRTIGTNTTFSAESSLGGTSTLCLDLDGNDALSSAGASGGGVFNLTEISGTFNVADRDNANANNQGTVTFNPAIGSFGNVASCPAVSL